MRFGIESASAPIWVVSWRELLRGYLGSTNFTGNNIPGKPADLPAAVCPESPNRFGYGENLYAGYDNSFYVATPYYHRFDQVARPSAMALIIDAIYPAGSSLLQSPFDPSAFNNSPYFVRSGGYTGTQDSVVYFVHLNGVSANAAWIDGHSSDRRQGDGFVMDPPFPATPASDCAACDNAWWSRN